MGYNNDKPNGDKKILWRLRINFYLIIAVGIIALAALALNAWILGLIYNSPERFLCDVTSCPLSLPAHDGPHRPPGAGSILICHNPGPNQFELIVQNNTSLEAHLGHGDNLGSCGVVTSAAEIPATGT